MKIRNIVGGVMLAGLCAAMAAPASAQEKTGVKEGFVLRSGTARIILMRPSIRVGSQSAGGMFEPNADWTAQARENIEREITRLQSTLGNKVVTYEEGLGNESALASQYSNLFSSVAESAIEYQFFKGNRLPTKKKTKGLEWSLGPGLAQMPSLEGADYLLFINSYDSIGSTGRKVLQIVGLLAGVAVTSGEHKGYAGLVDLRTGELVWLNVDMAVGGDVRTPEGAAKRVSQLLEDFPGREETD
jgi:hypothetical protein